MKLKRGSSLSWRYLVRISTQSILNIYLTILSRESNISKHVTSSEDEGFEFHQEAGNNC